MKIESKELEKILCEEYLIYLTDDFADGYNAAIEMALEQIKQLKDKYKNSKTLNKKLNYDNF